MMASARGISAWIALGLVLASSDRVWGSQAGGSARALSAGAVVEAALAAGEGHSYSLDLVAEQFVSLTVLQQGIDVAVSVVGPGEVTVVDVDGPTGQYGSERVRFIAGTAGAYRVDVRSLEKRVPPGRYRLDVRELRMAGDDDRRRVDAQAAYLSAIRLRFAGKADALRQAIGEYERSATLWGSVGETVDQAAAENDRGYAYRLLSDYPNALVHYERALALRRQAGDGPGEAQTLTNLGAIAYLLGENQRALGYYEAALPLRRAEGNFQEEALLLSNMGEVFMLWSDHQRALEQFRAALPAQRRMGDQLRESITLSNIGLVYRSTGQYGESLELFDEALRAARASGNRRVEARVLVNRGAAFADLGDAAGALDSYQQALALQRASGDRLGESETLNAIGVILMRRGEHEQALDHYTRALTLQRAVGSRRNEATTLTNIGAARFEMESLEEARKALEESLSLRRAVQDRRGEAQTLYVLARVQRGQGRLADALTAADAALEIVEALRTKLVSQEMRASYFATSLEMYEFATATLMDLHAANPGAGYDARAFHVTERARARTLLDGLVEAQGSVEQGVSEELRLRERSLRDRINAGAERQIQLLSGQHSADDASRATREMNALLTELRELEAEIRSRSPRYAELIRPRPLEAAAVQQLLDGETILLEYALGRERSFLWVLTRDSLESHSLPPRADVEAAARRFYGLITARNDEQPGETPAARRRRITSADADSEGAARGLGRMLLGPVAGKLSTRRLLIVAEGALQYIPFGALIDPSLDSVRAPEPLIVNHEVALSPSASTLALLRTDRAKAAQAARAVAIIADPVFSADDPRLRRSPSPPDPIVPPEVTRAGSDVGLSSFRRLRFSREEAEAIRSLTKPNERLEAVDFQASRATAVTTDLSQYRIVHFSTHGLLNNAHPELSGLVLSLYDEQGKTQDGFLRLHDIYNLRLNADLVVLSACETALGREIRGEGLIGLARGFMYAGASRVVASLWNVEDQATASLMKQFYQDMLANGQAPAAALRAAQIAMRRSKRWHAPYYWAAFVLQGEK
jgi:CHAT domain-containing protein/tetratricopeptide (TPR) repeat protein